MDIVVNFLGFGTVIRIEVGRIAAAIDVADGEQLGDVIIKARNMRGGILRGMRGLPDIDIHILLRRALGVVAAVDVAERQVGFAAIGAAAIVPADVDMYHAIHLGGDGRHFFLCRARFVLRCGRVIRYRSSSSDICLSQAAAIDVAAMLDDIATYRVAIDHLVIPSFSIEPEGAVEDIDGGDVASIGVDMAEGRAAIDVAIELGIVAGAAVVDAIVDGDIAIDSGVGAEAAAMYII